MLIILTGTVGSGKTAFASVIAKFTKNRKIKANYELKLHNYEKLEPEKLMDLPEGEKYLIIIDECYVWLESFTSGNKIERYLSYILFQSRKLNVDIILTSQLSRRVNINFKEMEDLRIECSKDEQQQVFRYTFKYVENNELYESTYEIPISKMGELCDNWNLYQTMERINPPEMRELSYEFIYKDKVKMNELVDKVARGIMFRKDLFDDTKITKESISNALLVLGFPAKLLTPVYNRIKVMVK